MTQRYSQLYLESLMDGVGVPDKFIITGWCEAALTSGSHGLCEEHATRQSLFALS